MLTRNFVLLFFILILALSLGFPGVALAEDSLTQTSNNIITIEAPEESNTGETLTIIARVTEKEYDEPVAGAHIDFFVKTDFFIKGLFEIGRSVTDEQGFARIDYTPNQPGELQIVASYKAESDLEPVVAQSMVTISGETRPVYQTVIGIGFLNNFYGWLLTAVISLSVVWGIFMFIIYKILLVEVSGGSKSKVAAIALMLFVTVQYIIIILILVTPEYQYNFGLLP